MARPLFKPKVILASGIAAIMIFLIAQAWRAQDGAGRTCNIRIKDGGWTYLEIELNRQQPVEPVFDAEFLFHTAEQPSKTPVQIYVTGSQGYAVSSSLVNVRQLDRVFFVGPKKGGLNPVSGSHKRFPFDSAHFDFEVRSDPPLSFEVLRIINRVDGFVIDCSTISGLNISDGSSRIQFDLYRNPLVQLAAIVIAAASIAFAILIFRSKTTEALSTAAASSFFSMWSVRSILSSQIHTFPTLLDLIMLTASIVLLMAVMWRVVFGFKKTAKA